MANLASWCALPKPCELDLCHAAVLLARVNNDTTEARADALWRTCEAVFGPARKAVD